MKPFCSRGGIVKGFVRPINIANPTQSVDETSRFLLVNRLTIRRWIRAGKIQAIMNTWKGYEVSTFEVVRIAGERNINLWNPAPKGTFKY